MPTVIVLGGDPLTFLMACSETPYGVCEYELVGGMRGAPLQVVRAGKITGLPIPANAEIVLEGFVDPKKRRPKDRLASGPATMPAIPAQSRCSISRPSITATTRSFSAALHSGLPTNWRAIVPSRDRRSCGKASRGRVCPACTPCGRTKSAPRACWSASPSSSAIPGIPSRRAMSPVNVMWALMPAST